MKFFSHVKGLAAGTTDSKDFALPLTTVAWVAHGAEAQGELKVGYSKGGDTDATDYVSYKVKGTGYDAIAAAAKQVCEYIVSGSADVLDVSDLPLIEGPYLKEYALTEVTTLALDEDVDVVVGTGVTTRPELGTKISVALVATEADGEGNTVLNYNKRVVEDVVYSVVDDLTVSFVLNENHPDSIFEASDTFKVVVDVTTETNKIGRQVISDEYTFIATNP